MIDGRQPGISAAWELHTKLYEGRGCALLAAHQAGIEALYLHNRHGRSSSCHGKQNCCFCCSRGSWPRNRCRDGSRCLLLDPIGHQIGYRILWQRLARRCIDDHGLKLHIRRALSSWEGVENNWRIQLPRRLGSITIDLYDVEAIEVTAGRAICKDELESFEWNLAKICCCFTTHNRWTCTALHH